MKTAWPLIAFVATLAAVATIASACARPKYYNQNSRIVTSEKAGQSADCATRFSKENLCVDYRWEQLPNGPTAGALLFKLFRANHADGSALVVDPRPGLTVAVEAWMPDMGHGSSPITINALDTGTYRASDVYLFMKGSWELRFELKQGEKLIDQATAPVGL